MDTIQAAVLVLQVSALVGIGGVFMRLGELKEKTKSLEVRVSHLEHKLING